MKRLLAAIRFLTVVPLPGTLGTDKADLAHSVPLFPIVGLLLGAAAAGLARAALWAAPSTPPLLAAAVTVIVLICFSGGLHIDGLADTADGLLSSRRRELMLEIMKDSRVGTMGVLAVAGASLLKFAALASLTPDRFWVAAFLMPLAGRCAMVLHIALLPSARPEGLGALFGNRGHRLAAVWAGLVMAAAACGLLGLPGLVLWAAWLAAALLLALYFWRKLGGATGDTFGAACELVELVPALTLALCERCGDKVIL